MKKKNIITLSFLALIYFLSTETVRAEWSGSGFVTKIQYNRDSYENGDVFIWLNGVGCSKTNEYFRIIQSDTRTEDLDAMVRLLTASKLANNSVSLGFTRKGGTCKIYAVALI